jgi:hypothetical protein
MKLSLPVYGYDRWSGTGRSVGRTGEPLHRLQPVPGMTRIQKSQNEERCTQSPNPTNTHSTKHELWSEGVVDINDSTGIGREGKKNPLSQQTFSGTRVLGGWAKGRSEKDREDVGTNQRPDKLVVFVRNSKGCEDNHQPVRDGCHCWGVRSKRNTWPKNPRHLDRSEQRQKSFLLFSGLGRLPTFRSHRYRF